MALTVDYTRTPFRITIAKADLTLDSGNKYNLTVDAFWRLLSDYSDTDEAMAQPLMYTRIPATSSTPSITEIRGDFYDLQFEDGLYSVNVISGNTNIRDVEVKNQVSVNTNNTTGFIDPSFLEFSTYAGAVWINANSGNSGTLYPTGTPAKPVNNLADAEIIASTRGFEQLNIVGTYVFAETDVMDGYIVQGTSASKTTLVLTAAASITNNAFRDCTLSGQFDGGNDASFCIIGSIDYIDGTLLDCFLTSGTVTLNGAQANFLRCASAVAGDGELPTIDMGGTGTNLVIRDYQGGIKLINHTSGIDEVSIDMSSGIVEIDSTISSGVYTIRGIGELVDNSTGTAHVRDLMIRNTDVANLKQLIELNRPHHTGTGKLIYWDPFGGNDVYDGDHIGRAVKTFAQAHNLAKDNGHDIIIAVSGDPAGVTTTNENITISKNYLFLRGPGRDFVMHSTNDALDTINITGNGVEVSGMVVTTEVTNTKNPIATSGDFPYIHNVYCTGSARGVLVVNSNYANIDGCQLSHNTDYGVRIEGNAIHASINMCHLGRNGGTGIEIDTVGGHDVVIGRSEIYGNGGYGVDIGASCENVMIRSDVVAESNTLGSVNDLGTATADFTGWVERARELHQMKGLSAANPITYTQNSIASGAISLGITGDGQTTSTVTRNV